MEIQSSYIEKKYLKSKDMNTPQNVWELLKETWSSFINKVLKKIINLKILGGSWKQQIELLERSSQEKPQKPTTPNERIDAMQAMKQHVKEKYWPQKGDEDYLSQEDEERLRNEYRDRKEGKI